MNFKTLQIWKQIHARNYGNLCHFSIILILTNKEIGCNGNLKGVKQNTELYK